MSRQGDACRAFSDSLEVAASLIFENVLDSIKEGKLWIEQDQLEILRQNILAGLSVAKDRGINQIIKATQD